MTTSAEIDAKTDAHVRRIVVGLERYESELAPLCQYDLPQAYGSRHPIAMAGTKLLTAVRRLRRELENELTT